METYILDKKEDKPLLITRNKKYSLRYGDAINGESLYWSDITYINESIEIHISTITMGSREKEKLIYFSFTQKAIKNKNKLSWWKGFKSLINFIAENRSLLLLLIRACFWFIMLLA